MLRNHPFHCVSGRVLQATLQEVYAVERKLHIHRQRELLSDPSRWAWGRGAGIWGIRFENHHLSREFWNNRKVNIETDETSVVDALKLNLWRAWLFWGPLHCFSTLLPLFCEGALLRSLQPTVQVRQGNINWGSGHACLLCLAQSPIINSALGQAFCTV